MNVIPLVIQDVLDGLSSDLADWTLDKLLDIMALAFELSKNPLVVILAPQLRGYHRNLRAEDGKPAFEGVYLFETKDGSVQECRIFKDGEMRDPKMPCPPDRYDIKIVFKDTNAFWKFLFSGGNDVMDSILDNDVEAYGNLNYLYKFGFMAKDLVQRLNVIH